MDVAKRLEDAMGTGELVSIRYHGGSQPGAIRDIAPLAIEGTKLRARCYASHTVKTFSLDKIEPLPTPARTADPARWQAGWFPDVEGEPDAVEDICPGSRERWAALGWSVRETADGSGFALRLHRPKKRGSGFLAAPCVELCFTPMRRRVVMTGDVTASGAAVLVEVEDGESARPWRLRTRSDTRTWKHYDKAAAAFREAADRGPGA
ncbi:hypothetical protein E3C22_18045 [Jiella endophytica]|uniref:WYL domain-containing protein n=1 Tax=Jiella endophytica TaxID=2558362 RepID=A0A4Y8REU4_9HYPH|nr:hypothetical protein [Jiella endophytica]TFF20792.1 hypothetical protein E3C22_18045 [Jiella endophytica]